MRRLEKNACSPQWGHRDAVNRLLMVANMLEARAASINAATTGPGAPEMHQIKRRLENVRMAQQNKRPRRQGAGSTEVPPRPASDQTPTPVPASSLANATLPLEGRAQPDTQDQGHGPGVVTAGRSSPPTVPTAPRVIHNPMRGEHSYPWEALLTLDRDMWVAGGRPVALFPATLETSRHERWLAIENASTSSLGLPFESREQRLHELYTQDLEELAAMSKQLAVDSRKELWMSLQMGSFSID